MQDNTQRLTQELQDFLDGTGRSQAGVARAIGYSSAVVSQWLDGTYKGDVTKIDVAIRAFLDREYERTSKPKWALPFVYTTSSRRFFETARICHHDSELGVVCSESGVGKTWAAREYVKKNPDVILYEVIPGDTAKVIFAHLHKRLGLDGNGMISTMFTDVVARLKKSGRMIIIDEAENLQHRALEMIRRLHDMAEIGVMLVGMERLISNLRGKRGEFRQLYSRIGIYTKLEPLKLKDVETALQGVIKNTNGLATVFHERSQGSMRTLNLLTRQALRLAEINKEPISKSLVIDAAKTLLT